MNNDDDKAYCGGSWHEDALEMWVANRGGDQPSYRDDFLGFRLSRLVNPLKQFSEVLDEQW